MHKNLICEASPFFKNAISRDWKEANEGVVTLPDDNVDVVHCYVRWIYFMKIFTPPPQENVKGDQSVQEFLGDCYAFGDKIQDLDFKDAIIDAYISQTLQLERLSRGMVKIVYAHSQADSPARKLFIDLLLWWCRQEPFSDRKRMKSEFPEDFLLDSLAALPKVRTNSYATNPLSDTTCIYHEHKNTGGPCYKKKRGNNL